MATLTVRLKKKQMDQLEKTAADHNKTVTEYVIERLELNDPVSENTLTQEKVLERIEKLRQGETFSLPDLFDPKEWEKFTNTVSVGRVFRITSKKKNSAVSRVAEFVDKKSGNPAVYKRK